VNVTVRPFFVGRWFASVGASVYGWPGVFAGGLRQKLDTRFPRQPPVHSGMTTAKLPRYRSR